MNSDNSQKWAKQLVRAFDGEQTTCPACGKNTIELKCYAFQDGMGFVQMKCNSCGDHILFDRVKFPAGIKVDITRIAEK